MNEKKSLISVIKAFLLILKKNFKCFFKREVNFEKSINYRLMAAEVLLQSRLIAFCYNELIVVFHERKSIKLNNNNKNFFVILNHSKKKIYIYTVYSIY